MSRPILISGGAGYIGSHAACTAERAGFSPVVIDNLSTGNAWATRFGTFEQGDVGDADFVRSICQKYQPVAAMHFAAFIEVGESVQNPAKYFTNNRDKASRFFDMLHQCGVRHVVFSSTAAVYGDAAGKEPLQETAPTVPINPYGQSKLEAETYLRSLDHQGMRSVSLRYFNVAGAAAKAGIGEAHVPETHLIPRLLLPLMNAPADILQALGLNRGFTIFGNDYPTPDGTAIRDYIHVLDLVDAHLRALDYLMQGGGTDIFNLGNGQGFSVLNIVQTARQLLNRVGYTPAYAPRRSGDPARLIASNLKATSILGWKPTRDLQTILSDAIDWHRSETYQDAIRDRLKNRTPR